MGRVLLGGLAPPSLIAATFVATSLVSVHAAELPLKAPPAPVYFNWTGPYFGVNLGGSWGRQSGEIFDESGAGLFGFRDHPDGVIGGGQIGYNWQFPAWFGWGNGTVLGLEADIQGSNERTSDGFGVLVPPLVTGSFEDKLQWFGTVRGRAGIAFDRVLPYVTGGWAVGNRKISGLVTVDDLTTTAFSTSSNLNDGWTVGAGIEWAFWEHWSAKFEYLYIDFGNRDNTTIFGPVIGTVSPLTVTTGHFIENIARAGVNYRF